jgi:hypothetical protein
LFIYKPSGIFGECGSIDISEETFVDPTNGSYFYLTTSKTSVTLKANNRVHFWQFISQNFSEYSRRIGLIHRRVLDDSFRGRILSRRVEGDDQKAIVQALDPLDYAHMASFIADYVENQGLRLPNWRVLSDKGTAEQWFVTPRLREETDRAFNFQNKRWGELFLPVAAGKAVLALTGNSAFMVTDDAPSFCGDLKGEAKRFFGSEDGFAPLVDGVTDVVRHIPKTIQIVLVGHGVGGTLAAAIAQRTNLEAITFNAHGLKTIQGAADNDQVRVRNYVVTGGIV